ncbi:MAG: tetratricopeptide repeat protein [Methanobacterium sp.]|nr:tetratricopeptide repeat protein [Methanobacterium sp.]
MVLGQIGKKQEALESYNKALELDPLEAAAWYGKSEIFQKLNNDPEALNCLNKVLELKPDCEVAKKAKEKILNQL